METLTASLAERWHAYQQQNPKTRIRDAARALHASEAELLATRCTSHPNSPVVFLHGDFQELLKQVPTLGRVLALTRNDSAVHERKGQYQKVSFNGHVGLVLGEDIDLRLFMSYWQFGFAVEENGRRSLQFFAADGEAVHKIYLLEESNAAAYDTLVAQFRASSQPVSLTTQSTPTPDPEADDAAIDVDGFRAAWRALQDTHEFFGLLRTFKVSRTQALRLAPPELVRRLDVTAIDQALRTASAQQLPVMLFVASRGCIQIHTGLTERIVPTGPWLNVLDPDFNLHLKLGDVAQAWAVQKPTADGIVTSVELFDAAGHNLLLLFGKRKPGLPEQEAWRELVSAL
ncbi:hemin-degrading factor [Hymenobacter mucosus]|uniref:Putative hemin transport protein n=1 Tax=Hymenobacter mucosus TaxID=1411120 RepID=A0A238Z954_9BACT|nr:ChuX/HutX family heme-like substrate-binding protein [Hymenobacter mucosus]SNR79498.1 putative hemin transport protein [Hymenobacter mucosus]